MSNYKNGLATRAALYQSARACFYRKGYFDTSIQDIVDAAHSKLGLFVYHFESKEAIANMVFREYVDLIRETTRASIGAAEDRADLLLDDMLNYRGYFKGVLCNQQTAKFYAELSSTPGYLEQNFRLKEFYFQQAQLTTAGDEQMLAERGPGRRLCFHCSRYGDPALQGYLRGKYQSAGRRRAGHLFGHLLFSAGKE